MTDVKINISQADIAEMVARANANIDLAGGNADTVRRLVDAHEVFFLVFQRKPGEVDFRVLKGRHLIGNGHDLSPFRWSAIACESEAQGMAFEMWLDTVRDNPNFEKNKH